MPTELYQEQRFVENNDRTLTLQVQFETIAGGSYESRRRITTRRPMTQELQCWIEGNQTVIERGIYQRRNAVERHPLVGGQAELVTLNGEVYFLAPARSQVTFKEYGTQADLHDGSHLSPYFGDEQDPLIALLNGMLERGETLGPLMKALHCSVRELGVVNLPESIMRYGLVPAMVYLGKGARERVDQIMAGGFARDEESGRLLAMSGVEVLVQEPEVARL